MRNNASSNAWRENGSRLRRQRQLTYNDIFFSSSVLSPA